MHKVKGLRWYIIGLIAVATVINYIDRSAINILWPYIHKEFGIAESDNKTALALITTFFMVAYAIGQTVTGKMMDAIGTRAGMTISIVFWSISIALHALAKSIASFSVFRFFLGISEAGNWPGATKSNAEWFPAKERGVAQGIFGAGASLGAVVSAPVIAGIYLAFGWRITFLSIAVLGFIWIIPWLLINKSTPDKHPWITEEELRHIGSDRKDQNEEEPVRVHTWKELLGKRITWSLLLSRFFIDPVWWLFVTWLPTFLKEEFSFDIRQVGAFAWVPYLFAAIGGLLGGWYAGRLIGRGVEAARARRNAVTIGSVIMLLSLGTIAYTLDSLQGRPEIAIGLISATLFGFQFLINNIQTLPADYFHGKNVGTVSGMSGTAAVLGTLITTWIVPVITKTSYTGFFIMAALMVPLGWICINYIRSAKNKKGAAVKIPRPV
jgi:ACS family hexuronate transporter-like MFS transporter